MFQIIITDKDDKRDVRAYEICATNIEIKSLDQFIRDWNGQAYQFEAAQQEVNLLVNKEPVAIELNEKVMAKIAAYNLDRKNQTLEKEIAFHESKLDDLKKEVERFKKILDDIKEIARDMVDGAEYERVMDDDEDYE